MLFFKSLLRTFYSVFITHQQLFDEWSHQHESDLSDCGLNMSERMERTSSGPRVQFELERERGGEGERGKWKKEGRGTE